jgi:hypothetical protein
MQNLPWLDGLLNPIFQEYTLGPPNYTVEPGTYGDVQYIASKVIPNDPFDKGKLKEYCIGKYNLGKADILKSTCQYGEIIIVSLHESPFRPSWNTWWRAVRLLSKNNPVKIVIFGHPKRREIDHTTRSIGPEELNGGSANRCDPRTIVIYRKEEATRVLIHELMHANCSDPYYKTTPHIEADTEAWAEMILCGLCAKGRVAPWINYMKQQITWTLRQSTYLRKKFSVFGSGDYAWRYITGKLEVWESLGIRIPWNTTSDRPIQSLRFTVCEPKNI